jgi:hypothetical protein
MIIAALYIENAELTFHSLPSSLSPFSPLSSFQLMNFMMQKEIQHSHCHVQKKISTAKKSLVVVEISSSSIVLRSQPRMEKGVQNGKN